MNEDLAATSVWGSQQIGLWPGAKVDGAFGIWYGKGPGVDRSMDALKHANAAGTAKHGGVLAVVGDDHGCQSSTLAHQSEQVLAAAMIPVLNPASVQEYFQFGLAGFALSRFSGCWVGFKTVSETVESGASVTVDPSHYDIVVPTDFEMSAGGLNIRWPDSPLEMERRLHGPRMAAVQAFARANTLDRLVWSTPKDRFGIATTGKSYLDVLQALVHLRIDAARANELGIRLYKIGLSWPLEQSRAIDFAEGLEEVFVIEEKLGVVEDQLVAILYNRASRPRVVGKRDETGRPLIHSTGELSPTEIARSLAERLGKALGVAFDGLELGNAPLPDVVTDVSVKAVSKVERIPFFCSGCPHNTSTKVPEGSRAMAGIGCHGMSIWMPTPRAETVTHMGGEGANWIGQAPFSGDKHVFQNLGDGTYFHSGLMAIRAAAAAGVNITYKILFNDAVAMTGGQPHDGTLSVPLITRQVAAEGARTIVIVTDEPEKYAPEQGFAEGVTVRHRSLLDTVQRELRETPGLTILIYDQTCAAEKRRRRKRGQYPDPDKRVFINPAVCEGCGDCSAKSNCVSVAPLETELGRKRQIDQSSCNMDFSCLDGFCPSFVTVHGARLRKGGRGGDSAVTALPPLEEPELPALNDIFGILVTGIGGTGVVTIGSIIGMAAHLENRGCSVLDFAGLAQKNGAVMSHIQLAPSPDDLLAARIDRQGADLVLGCDAIVTATPDALATIKWDETAVILNSHLQPTAGFVNDGNLDFNMAGMMRSIRNAAGEAKLTVIDATTIATAQFGDAIAANLFMLGFAWQRRLVPLSHQALMRAIELNGVAISMNKAAFEWGRQAAQNPEEIRALSHPGESQEGIPARSLDGLIDHRAGFLARYQNAGYAERYRALISGLRTVATEQVGNREELTRAIAQNLFKLMAYKDEYEVARLYTDGAFRKALERTFEGDFSIEFHMAPPLLTRFRTPSGEPRKMRFGPWMLSAMKVLASMKWLRGTKLDPFGYSSERRLERQMIDDYVETMRAVVARLTPDNYETAVEISEIPSNVRGFGHVKLASIERAKVREAELLRALDGQAAGGQSARARGLETAIAAAE